MTVTKTEKELIQAVRVALKDDSINLHTYNKAKMDLAKYRNETKTKLKTELASSSTHFGHLYKPQAEANDSLHFVNINTRDIKTMTHTKEHSVHSGLSGLYQRIETQKHRSAWDKGVLVYALELVEDLEYEGLTATKKNMLNGADTWEQFSYGGSSLIFDADIAERLCTPSEYKKKKEGDLPPNGSETWLDTQARALHQACNRVLAAKV